MAPGFGKSHSPDPGDPPPQVPPPPAAPPTVPRTAPSVPQSEATSPEPAVAAPAPTPAPAPDPPRRTRISGVWVSLILAALVLILLLVFIIQNSARVDISFLGFHGHLSLGVALLLAAVSGMLLLALPGTGRILQLRRQVRQGRKTFIHERGDDPQP